MRGLNSFLEQAQIELVQAKEHAELYSYSADLVAKIDVLKRAIARVVRIAKAENGAMGRITVNQDRHEEANL